MCAKPRTIFSDCSHLHTPEVRAKRSVALKGSTALKDAVKKIHKDRIASGEDKLIRAKIRETMIAKGRWLDKNESEYEEYCRAIRTLTRKQPIETLANHELRGRGKDKYHLDHVVSRKSGFEYKLPPEMVAHITNLRFISEHDNCSKQGHNPIEDVLALYYSSTVTLD